MKRWLLALPIVMALALVACSGDSTTVVSSEDSMTGIVVDGRGEVTAPPDTASISLGVEVVRPTVAEAREQAATAATAVIDSAKANGVDDADIQTTSIAIYPVYDYRSDTPVITGYTVSNTVTVKVRNLDDIGPIIDDAAEAAGDFVRVNSISFSIEDNEALLTQAREAAMQQARSKAEQLASLGEVSLGKPLSITETLSSAPPPDFFRAAELQDAAAATPIEIGTGSVVVTLSVRWAIEE